MWFAVTDLLLRAGFRITSYIPVETIASPLERSPEGESE